MTADDQHLVHGAIEHAKLQDVDCYIAERDPQYGHSLSGKIEEAIRRSQCVVVLWTRGGATHFG